MMGGAMFLLGMFDSGIHMKHKFTKKYLGAVLFRLELSMKRTSCGYCIPKAHGYGRNKIKITPSCS